MRQSLLNTVSRGRGDQTPVGVTPPEKDSIKRSGGRLELSGAMQNLD